MNPHLFNHRGICPPKEIIFLWLWKNMFYASLQANLSTWVLLVCSPKGLAKVSRRQSSFEHDWKPISNSTTSFWYFVSIQWNYLLGVTAPIVSIQSLSKLSLPFSSLIYCCIFYHINPCSFVPSSYLITSSICQ